MEDEETLSTINKPEFVTEQKEGIKLIRGQRGNYGWEIRILSLDLEQLKKIDAELRKTYIEDEGKNAK